MSQVRRRQFLIATGVLLLEATNAVFSQDLKSGKIYRIGCVPGGPMPPREHQWAEFRKGLTELGYVEGKNIVLEFRVPQEGIRADDLIADLVRQNVDVMVVSNGFHAQSAKRISKTIPIVLTGAVDPVASGLVASLARPEGNVTGLSLYNSELGGKRLELLRELLPKSRRIAILINRDDPSNTPQLKAVQDAGRSMKVEIIPVEARAPEDLRRAFQAAAKRHAEGLIVASSGLFYGQRTQIMDLAQHGHLPAIWPWESFGGFGALLVYGPSDTDNYHRAAYYVDRILKGAKPGDLPVEQPTQVKLVVNLTTARTLKLSIPKSLILRADRVIE